MSNTITDVAPAELLTDLNVRTDLRLNKEFVASIKDHGVLSPIVAVHTPDGLRVRQGHRRTAAAVEAGLATVPVVVIDTDAEGDTEAIERLLTQHAENTHRAGLTVGEDANVAHQLSLLGLSATQIARRTHTKKAHVEAGIKIAASELASKATERYDLTLDQAVTVAEFEHDTDTVKALIVAAKEGKFDHIAQRARDARDTALAQAPMIEALTAEGITVIERPNWNDDATNVDRLRTNDGTRLDPEAHTQCPGHAVYLTEREVYTEPDGTVLDANRWGDVNWPEGKEPADDDEAEARWAAVTVTLEWDPEPVCTNPGEHGHLTDSQWYERQGKPTKAADKTDAEREADKKARAFVIQSNKDWKSAREVRREWVKQYLGRKTPPPSAWTFIAQTLSSRPQVVGDTGGNKIAAEWFNAKAADYGHSTDLAKVIDKTDDKRAGVIALGMILADHEADAGDGAWRTNGEASSTGHYLRYLVTLGYTLSDVEQFAASKNTA